MSLLLRIRDHLVIATLVSLAAVSSSSAQTKAYVGNFKDNTVSVVDTAGAKVVATLPVGAGPHGMAVSADGRQVFVGADTGSTITVIDTTTDRVAGEIEIGKSPHGFAMLPDGRALLAGVYGEDKVVWVDVQTRQPTFSVAVAKPHTIAVHPDGHLAYVASQQPGDFALVVIDVDRHTVLRRIALAKPPRDLEFGMDDRLLYFTTAGDDAVQVLDPKTDAIVGRIATGPSPHVAKVANGSSAGFIVVQGPGELMRFDAASRQPGASIRVGSQPHWMSLYDRGRAVAVTNEGSDSLSLVDLATGTVRSVDVGRAPRKVVTVAAVGGVAAARDQSIAIRHFAFEPATLTVTPGTTVIWRNEDALPHAIGLDDRKADGDVLLPGQDHAENFPTAGTFGYHCSTHPFMVGRIVVTAR